MIQLIQPSLFRRNSSLFPFFHSEETKHRQMIVMMMRPRNTIHLCRWISLTVLGNPIRIRSWIWRSYQIYCQCCCIWCHSIPIWRESRCTDIVQTHFKPSIYLSIHSSSSNQTEMELLRNALLKNVFSRQSPCVSLVIPFKVGNARLSAHFRLLVGDVLLSPCFGVHEWRRRRRRTAADLDTHPSMGYGELLRNEIAEVSIRVWNVECSYRRRYIHLSIHPSDYTHTYTLGVTMPTFVRRVIRKGGSLTDLDRFHRSRANSSLLQNPA